MGINVDDLDDDDFLVEDVTPSNEPDDSGSHQEEDFVSDILKSKGIEDPSKIKFEENDGTIIERSWNDLSREEQINIINTPLDVTEPNDNYFDEEEINLINQIRNSGLTPSQYLEQIQSKEQDTISNYQVDSLSDDELFLLDLEARVGELTEEEAVQALNNAKQNEQFYNKQVEGIRKEYKEKEDFRIQQEEAQIEEEQRQAYEDYQSKIITVIDNFNSIGNLDLNFEDKDKEELADFMLSQDENGLNYLYQSLQDPEILVKAAWFILNGEEAFDNISDYFKNQIKLVSQSQYKKGFEDGKKGTNNLNKPTIVIDPKKSKNKINQYTSIDELDDED